jgi:hypothetical protein
MFSDRYFLAMSYTRGLFSLREVLLSCGVLSELSHGS